MGDLVGKRLGGLEEEVVGLWVRMGGRTGAVMERFVRGSRRLVILRNQLRGRDRRGFAGERGRLLRLLLEVGLRRLLAFQAEI